jgi:hypothetical protein
MNPARRVLLTAALGFLQLRQDPPEVMVLRQWLDTWSGLGAVVEGMRPLGGSEGVLGVAQRREEASLDGASTCFRTEVFMSKVGSTTPGGGAAKGQGISAEVNPAS